MTYFCDTPLQLLDIKMLHIFTLEVVPTKRYPNLEISLYCKPSLARLNLMASNSFKGQKVFNGCFPPQQNF